MPDSIAFKQAFSVIAFLLTIALFADYIRAVRVAHTVPHVLSWMIWAAGTLMVCFAQLADGAGVGAWPIGFSGCLTGYIAFLAYAKRHQSSIKRLDWFFFALALSALPAWWLTSDPLWTVVLLTFADVIAFGPTFRRAYDHPHQERAMFFLLCAFRNLLVIFALERYSWTTILFPAVIGFACLLLASLLYFRRRAIAKPAD